MIINSSSPKSSSTQHSDGADEARRAARERAAEQARKAAEAARKSVDHFEASPMKARSQTGSHFEAASPVRAMSAAAAPVPKEVQRWWDHCEPFRGAATKSLDEKLKLGFPRSPLPNGTTVEEVVKTGARSPVYVGGASKFPGSENLPVFFQNFDLRGERVQVYSYQRKNGEQVSFDVSGDLAKAYSSEHFTSGQAGTNSVLGLPNSGRQLVDPAATSDWHVTAFRNTPEVAALMQSGQGFGYQEFEGGVLVELGEGKIQAFRFDSSVGEFKAMGTPHPDGRIADGGFPPVTALPGAASVQAGHFMVDGQPFKHVGANLSQVLYESPGRMKEELVAAKNAGVKDVRVFLPNSDLTTQEVGDRLEVMLNEAKALGMKVTVSLTSFARQEFYTGSSPEFMGGKNNPQGNDFSGAFAVVKGDQKYYDWLKNDDGSLALGHPVIQDSWYQGGYKENFRPFVETIVDRFKDNPAVFAWEVANESKSYAKDPDFGAVKGFYADMVQLIREKAPRQMVTAGLTNSREFVGDNEAAQREFLRQFDFVSVHQYVNAGVPDNQSSIDTDVRLARELGRPVVLGEFGFYNGVPSEKQVRDYLAHATNVWGMDSIVPWAAGNHGEAWWKDFGMEKFHQILRDTNGAYEAWNRTN